MALDCLKSRRSSTPGISLRRAVPLWERCDGVPSVSATSAGAGNQGGDHVLARVDFFESSPNATNQMQMRTIECDGRYDRTANVK